VAQVTRVQTGIFNREHYIIDFGQRGVILRAYPNNPLYCGRLQSPKPALSAKNVLSVEKTTPPSIFGLPPWPRTFRSAS